MSADPVEPDLLAAQARNAPLTRPRPGHADLVGMQKYGLNDARPVLERASARETAARVALGTVALAFLRQAAGVELVSHVVGIGKAELADGIVPSVSQRDDVDEDPVRCVDPTSSAAMVDEIEAARKEGDTLGGVVEVVVYGLPPGLGSHVHWDRRIDSQLAGALMGIQAIKGVEVGDGFDLARRRGSQAHDEIVPTDGGVRRATGRAGGTEGGMTTGEALRVRAAMKPISTVPRALDTVDVSTGEPAKAINQRSDVCAVPAAAVVAEAMVALVLSNALLEKFGGDSVTETARNVSSYLEHRTVKGPPLPVRWLCWSALQAPERQPSARHWQSDWASNCGTPTTISRSRRAHRSQTSSSSRAKKGFESSNVKPWLWQSQSTMASWRSAPAPS
jgi:chorismate synthase